MIHDMTNYLLCYSLNQKCGVPIGAVLSMLTVVFMSTWMPTHIPKDAIGCLRPYDCGVDQEQHVHSMSPAMQQLPGSDLILGSQNWVSHRAGRENLTRELSSTKREWSSMCSVGLSGLSWRLEVWFWFGSDVLGSLRLGELEPRQQCQTIFQI